MSIILYEHSDFRGAHKHISGFDEPNLHADGWGDRVSSIQVIWGEWQFCEHVNYGGNKVNLTPGSYRTIHDVGIKNDSISSVRRIGGSRSAEIKELIIFEHSDFRGAHKHLIDRDEPNLHADGWGDRVSSFIIISGKWAFFKDVNYGHEIDRFDRANSVWSKWVENLGIPNDSVSSIKRIESVSDFDDTWNQGYVTVFEHVDFRGEHKHLFAHEPNLHIDGWGDRISSIQINIMYPHVFYEDINFRGNSVELQPGNYRNVADIGIPNDSISSVRWHG